MSVARRGGFDEPILRLGVMVVELQRLIQRIWDA